MTRAPCPCCRGAARFTCWNCDGTPVRRCWNCNADDAPPEYLNEIGVANWHARHRNPDCRPCLGTGEIRCCACDAGIRACPNCDGSGDVEVRYGLPVVKVGYFPRHAPGIVDRSSPDFRPGLGSFVIGETGTRYHLSPSGSLSAVYRSDVASLVRPDYHGQTCGCHEGPHRCGECGANSWIEIHGMADGYCARCWYHG